ncbi:Short-chain dehydrogenase, partial [Geosmithia morbida]
IGLAFARLLLAKGCSVILADKTLRPETQTLLDEYAPSSSSAVTDGASSKPQAIFHETDVTSWSQLDATFTRATTSLPSLDIVAASAGLEEPTWASFWEKPTGPDPNGYAVLDVNLTAPVRLSQLAISHWTRSRRPGCLVHVGSQAGYTSGLGTPLYFASKHGLHGFVRSLAALKGELGIRSGCVAPGAVRTPMWSEDPSKASMVDESIDFSEPEEIASAMYDLVVDENLGSGTIYECTKANGTRVVPEFNAPPPPAGSGTLEGYVAAEEKLYERLREEGTEA